MDKSHIALKVPKPIKSDIKLDMNLYDTSDRYLPANQSFNVPVNSPSPYVTDGLLLLTKDGKGCVGAKDESACWAGKTLQYTDIEVLVKDEEDGDTLKDITVKLYSGLDAANYLGNAESNDNGYATFNNAAYDYYTVVFDGDGDYLPTSQNFKVQSKIEGDSTLYLHKRTSTSAIIEESIYNTTADKDLALRIRSFEGKECMVDPLNKWCAYAEHVNDIEKNKSGYEKIKINKFTVSHYLAYLKDAPAYSGTCGNNDPKMYKYYPDDDTTMRSLRFDWDKVRKLNTTSNFKTLYCFTGWGLISKKAYRKQGTGEPSASVCAKMYPTTSRYNLDKLKNANSK